MSKSQRGKYSHYLSMFLIIGLVSVVAIAALTATGGQTRNLLGQVSGTLSSTGSGSCAPYNQPLRELSKSYVDKLTRMTPGERSRLKVALQNFALHEQKEESIAADNDHFVSYGVNPFVETKKDKLSTFAIDVDTASYTVMRNYINRSGNLPPQNSVRVEEYVNYFDYEYAAPEKETFAIHAEAAPSPYRKNHLLLRLGIKGREVEKANRRPLCLTFVVDISGSMSSRKRLPLVRKSLAMLVDELQEGDKVGIAVYGSRGRVYLDYVDAEQKTKIKNAIARLHTEGATNAEEGLVVGYQMAARSVSEDRDSRVILCSDGVANVGRRGPKAILAQIKENADKGIYLTTVGFGMGSYNDRMMEQLANKGNGVYAYIDSYKEAKRLFVEKLTGTMLTIAKDAKIQVEFSEENVRRYRLLGYENRDLADKDFRNDAVDAGEVGAGHSVTALYELELTDTLKANLGTVRVRYQAPRGTRVTEVQEHICTDCIKPSFAKASAEYRLAAVLSQYGEILRKSEFAKGRTISSLVEHIDKVASELKHDEQVVEFCNLVKKAAQRELRVD